MRKIKRVLSILVVMMSCYDDFGFLFEHLFKCSEYVRYC